MTLMDTAVKCTPSLHYISEWDVLQQKTNQMKRRAFVVDELFDECTLTSPYANLKLRLVQVFHIISNELVQKITD